MSKYTISEIEQAINFWRGREGLHDGDSQDCTASSIASIYGSMIKRRQKAIKKEDICKDLVGHIDLAIKQQCLPL